ncbi:MAG: hypothetical protein PVF26_09220 [Desulfobacterales bacterium]|jgi:hypothetical protein
MKQYNLVFEGAVSDGRKVEDVKSNLATLFKVDEKKIDHLFTAPSAVIKKNVNYDQAMQYKHAMQKVGAICKVTEVIENIDQQAAETPSPPPLPQSAGVQMVGGVTQSQQESEIKEYSEPKTKSGVGDIIAGVVLIGIGLVFGGSVFTGNPDLLDYFFDGLGLFWIGKGIYRLVR